MTLDTPTCIAILGVGVSAVAAAGAFGAGLYSFFITPYRVQQAEKRLDDGDKRFTAIELSGNSHSVSLGQLSTSMMSMADDIHAIKGVLQVISQNQNQVPPPLRKR